MLQNCDILICNYEYQCRTNVHAYMNNKYMNCELYEYIRPKCEMSELLRNVTVSAGKLKRIQFGEGFKFKNHK